MRGTVHDVTERARLEAAVRRMAYQDPLTGLANRRVFSDRLGDLLAGTDAETCAVLFIDLDDFKQINDRYGHVAGDGVLQQVATRLSALVGEIDTVARVGGDEFAMICVDTNLETARRTAHRIETELGLPMRVNGSWVDVRASVGVAVPEAGDSVDRLLRAADSAMYSAKRQVRESA